jgi:hypothetical protein
MLANVLSTILYGLAAAVVLCLVLDTLCTPGLAKSMGLTVRVAQATAGSCNWQAGLGQLPLLWHCRSEGLAADVRGKCSRQCNCNIVQFILMMMTTGVSWRPG